MMPSEELDSADPELAAVLRKASVSCQNSSFLSSAAVSSRACSCRTDAGLVLEPTAKNRHCRPLLKKAACQLIESFFRIRILITRCCISPGQELPLLGPSLLAIWVSAKHAQALHSEARSCVAFALNCRECRLQRTTRCLWQSATGTMHGLGRC